LRSVWSSDLDQSRDTGLVTPGVRRREGRMTRAGFTVGLTAGLYGCAQDRAEVGGVLREQAIEAFKESESRRVAGWRASPGIAVKVAKTANEVVGLERHRGGPQLMPPVEVEADVTVDWHRSSVVATFPDDPVRLLVHVTDVGDRDDPASVQADVYVLGPCPRCDRLVPLHPAVTSLTDVGAALLAGVPADGHHCARAAG
jgi:hypothetical protein